MEEALKELRVARGRIKTAITNFKKTVNELKDKEEVNRVAMIKLESKYEKIIPRLDEYTRLHFKICDLTGDEDDNELEEFTDAYYEGVAEAKFITETYYNDRIDVTSSSESVKSVSGRSQNSGALSKVRIDKQDTLDENVISQGQSMPQSSMCEAKIKLPIIPLPSFNGNSNNWLEFRDVFRSLIHDDSSLAAIKKFHYLKSALEGDAKQIIQGFETSEANYRIAWSNLCDRYENQRLLIQNHLSAIYKLPNITRESAKDLREIIDKVNYNLRALESLNQPVQYWDTIIIYTICSKLDRNTIREWEARQSDSISSLEKFKKFLRERANVLDAIQAKNNAFDNSDKYRKDLVARKSFVTSRMSCYYCEKEHSIYSCTKFLNLSIPDRTKAVERNKLCVNCLRKGHQETECDKSGCRRCNKRHNSLLHEEIKDGAAQVSAHVSCHAAYKSKFYVLSTAEAEIQDRYGQSKKCRLLLDNCSQPNFITEAMAKQLGIPIRRIKTQVSGVNQGLSNIHGECDIIVKSRLNDTTVKVNCLVIPKISEVLPQVELDMGLFSIPSKVELADPTFAIPGRIDILLGVSIFWDLILSGRNKLASNGPHLIETTLGWIVAGIFPEIEYAFLQTECLISTQVQIQNDLTRFWGIEEVKTSMPLSDDELYCQDHFEKTTKRTEEGRFEVCIPWKLPTSKLGDSKEGAIKRFLTLERKLQGNPRLKEQYQDFINEYKKLNHMTLLEETNNAEIQYFLPHHCVVNEASSTTKLRVVFDGSFQTATGYSRNSIESVGPVIQSDLMSILLRFRTHPIAISADIEKMYRQVLVSPADRSLQQIIWRDHPFDSIEAYQLNTITYGTAASAFLATRCLSELSNEIKETLPRAAKIIKEDFYVDDLLTGVDNVLEGQRLCREIKDTLLKGCFPLRKWKSNVPEVIQDLDGTVSDNNQAVAFCPHETTKTLGLYWLPSEDVLLYSITIEKPEIITKRVMLSLISRIYDPLGLLGACIIKAKMLLQALWLERLDWNHPVPKVIESNWQSFYSDLETLNQLRIPRYCLANNTNLQLHGFADASEKAYGACLYLRSVDQAGDVSIHLLCAKSKVAPIKTLTIPKLELCAALVLANLVKSVQDSLRLTFSSIHLWTDSSIVLGWLSKQLSLLKIFVANRVVKIKDRTNNCPWGHVPSKENPADLISRGIMPTEILTSTMWWEGPSWLRKPSDLWPKFNSSPDEELPELRGVEYVAHTSSINSDLIDIERFSNYTRLLRSMAYALRFIDICKRRVPRGIQNELRSEEISNCLFALIKFVQHHAFCREIESLLNNEPIKSSKLICLAPFLDEKGVLRVGGRLHNANVNFDAKHQILLPSNNRFTKLLLEHEHKRLGHAGPQLLLCSIRDRYWPLRGKDLAKEILHKCTICHRLKPKFTPPFMGSLPEQRVNKAHPFETTGVDYAGPLIIKDRKGRGCKTSKCYISVFVCFAIKAVHLEVVSELTTEAFLAAFRRFVSRRGKPSSVWSDNGTNFVGADNELNNILKSLDKDLLISAVATDQIQWRFIPANSPHFGGLWESGVKSIKFHLKRMVGNASLTFEELTTLCCQIEAILNSRPLCPLSNDPNDFDALTPAHFLIGRQLTALPDEDLQECKLGRLSRFQLIQNITQHFWSRWQSEYLPTLQPRRKWRTKGVNLTIGALVLVKDDNKPPLKWLLARIVDVHPGKDDQVRVATVRTASNIFKRSVTKLFPLPIYDEAETA